MPTEESKLKISKTIGLSILVIGAIFAVIGSTIMVPLGLLGRQNVASALSGELIPFKVDKSKPFQLAFSPTFSMNYNYQQLAQGVDLNDVFNGGFNITTNQFKIQFINNKISVSANIRDSNGTLIAEIVNNEWKTVDPNYQLAFWDRNYNAYAFEIINRDNLPIFQVIMVGPNRIQVDGLFYTSFGNITSMYFEDVEQNQEEPTFYFDQNGGLHYLGITSSGLGDLIMIPNPTDKELEDLNVTRLFHYPALTDPSNLGKTAIPIVPSNNPLSDPTNLLIAGIIFAIIGAIMSASGFESYKDANRKIQELKEQERKEKERLARWERLKTSRRKR